MQDCSISIANALSHRNTFVDNVEQLTHKLDTWVNSITSLYSNNCLLINSKEIQCHDDLKQFQSTQLDNFFLRICGFWWIIICRKSEVIVFLCVNMILPRNGHILNTVGCNSLSLPEMTAHGNKVLNYSVWCKQRDVKFNWEMCEQIRWIIFLISSPTGLCLPRGPPTNCNYLVWNLCIWLIIRM